MDQTIRRILGEADGEDEKPEAKPEQSARPDSSGAEPVASPDESEIEELASLWTTGNKGEVIRRFMEMDNEKSVKLVFAIGREGALELARMVDQAMEQGELPGDEAAEHTTEPSRIERPDDVDLGGYPTRELLGKSE